MLLIGESPVFLRAVKLLARFALSEAPVLIEGETGTGKELAARHIHYESRRKTGPFVPINCGAIPDSLFENEFFGHHRGAFTDARGESEGCVGLASGGTILLDEMDALSPKGQVALLRLLQDNTYRPVGGGAEQHANVRIIGAANVSLDALAQRREFRHDLLFRIKLLFVEMPPLRARNGDVQLLADHVLADCSHRYSLPRKQLGASAKAWMRNHHWPGNVRELENVVHRAFLLSDGQELTVADLSQPRATGEAAPAGASGYREAKAQAMADFHRRYLVELLEASGGNVSSAARRCGADRRLLGRLMKRYRIGAEQFRRA